MSRRPSESPTLPDLPADVADRTALRVWLEDADILGSPDAVENHLLGSLDRYRYTAALLPKLPRGARVLELGSNPYFLTRILKARGLNVTCANWFGDGLRARAGEEIVNSPRRGERTAFAFDHFNAEADAFPYPDDNFDAVLCCGILELLPSDPTHLLAETHRVLKREGSLILTTPNAVRSEIVRRVLDGWPVQTKLSGHGVYGRANREYTIGEVTDLLTELGYEVDIAQTFDTAPDSPKTVPAEANPANRGDTVFVRARARGRARWRYPTWLYASNDVRWHVVQPDVVMGHNDDLQTRGFAPLDTMRGRFGRWTSDSEGVVLLISPGPSCHVIIEGDSPPANSCRRMELTVSSTKGHASWTIQPDSGMFRVEAPLACDEGTVELHVSTDRTWRPIDIGLNQDRRSLGLMVYRVALVPAPIENAAEPRN